MAANAAGHGLSAAEVRTWRRRVLLPEVGRVLAAPVDLQVGGGAVHPVVPFLLVFEPALAGLQAGRGVRQRVCRVRQAAATRQTPAVQAAKPRA